jgi:hypothetical protein
MAHLAIERGAISSSATISRFAGLELYRRGQMCVRADRLFVG